LNILDASCETLNPDETRVAIESLRDPDWLKLRKIASIHASRCKANWEDILNEAFCRALEDRRKCKKNLNIIVFLDGTMRSIANYRNKASKSDPLEHVIPIFKETDEGLVITVDLPDNCTPDNELEAQQTLESFEELFDGDDEATMVLMGHQDNLPPNEIQELAGLNKTQYATVLRRIRRRFEKLATEGATK